MVPPDAIPGPSIPAVDAKYSISILGGGGGVLCSNCYSAFPITDDQIELDKK